MALFNLFILFQKLLNEEELHSSNCKEALEVIHTQFQSIFNPWVMRQSEFIDAFYQKFWVSYTTFRTQCINQMDELEKILDAEEAEFNEIEKLNREKEQKEREMQLEETEMIEKETEKDVQNEEEIVNEGDALDVSLVLTKQLKNT